MNVTRAPGRVEGKVALVTGAARGLGRAYAVRLAEEGAQVVLLDVCRDLETSSYHLARPEDLEETRRLVEAAGREAIAQQADVRDQEALDAAVADALSRFGHIDIVAANAGVSSFGAFWELSDEQWSTALDVMLTGTWRTAKAVVPSMIEAGRGGSIVITGSVSGLKASPGAAHYSTAKHGLTGLARSLAHEVAPHSIRVNVVAPGSIRTELAANSTILKRLRPDLEDPTPEDAVEVLRQRNLLPVGWAEPVDVANAVLWLASDEARYVTGVVLPVDAGWTIK